MKAPSVTPTVPTPWLPAAVALVVGVVWRVLLVQQTPTAFSFDGFQRWAGREHLLIQDWLPLTQALLWLTARAGGGLFEGRVVMCLVSGLAAAAGTLLAQRLAEPRFGPGPAIWAGWAFVAASTFGPWTGWGSVFYQESTFLLVLFGGFWAAAAGRPWLGDLLVGALGLVRYEGWPCILVYLAWRRQPRAALALWGPALWLAVKAGGATGYAASPVDFADWNGLGERFELAAWWSDVLAFGRRLGEGGGLVWIALGVVGTWLHRRSGLAWALAAVCVLQLLATLGWIAGLEAATSRMVILPVMLAAVLGAAAVPWAARFPRAGWVALVGLVVVLGVQLIGGRERVRAEARLFRPEAAALEAMQECPGCRWWVVPRDGLGTRARHDGCEVFQGISSLREGHEFVCAPWADPAEKAALEAASEGSVRWDARRKAYRVERHLAGSGTPAD